MEWYKTRISRSCPEVCATGKDNEHEENALHEQRRTQINQSKGEATQPTAQRRASIWNTAGIGGELFADYRYIFGTGPALLATSNIVILYNTLYQQFFLIFQLHVNISYFNTVAWKISNK
jgi:hypothetical protein